MSNDAVLSVLDDAARAGDERLTCQRWLRDVPAKRFVFAKLYGDLINGPRRKVLDVGGGLTSLTRLLAQRNDYSLVDIMAHDDPDQVRQALDSMPGIKVIMQDWYEARLEDHYDVVVANDLFPNVDQRLELFLQKTLPLAGEIRLALTYYATPRFYRTKRVDADELLCMLAWDGAATRRCLEKQARHIAATDLAVLDTPFESPYPNQRQVCVITLRGE
jgi:hypothetical protein